MRPARGAAATPPTRPRRGAPRAGSRRPRRRASPASTSLASRPDRMRPRPAPGTPGTLGASGTSTVASMLASITSHGGDRHVRQAADARLDRGDAVEREVLERGRHRLGIDVQRQTPRPRPQPRRGDRQDSGAATEVHEARQRGDPRSSSAIAITSRVDACPPVPNARPGSMSMTRSPAAAAGVPARPNDEALAHALGPEVALPDVTPLVLVRLAPRQRHRVGRHPRRAQPRASRLDRRPARPPPPRARSARRSRPSALNANDGLGVPNLHPAGQLADGVGQHFGRRRRNFDRELNPDARRSHSPPLPVSPAAAISERRGASPHDGAACAPRASCASASPTASRSNAAA